MKNNNLKKVGMLSLIIMMITSFFSGFVLNVEATSVPKSFTATAEKYLDGYIANYHFAKKKSSTGGYVYCNNIHKGTPHGEKMTLVGQAPAGIAYILANGYPSKSITGNSDYDYYITQTAVWWYLDDTTGSSNLSQSFKTTGSDSYGLRKYVKALVSAAKNVKDYTTASISVNSKSSAMTLSSDKKYYVSNAIGVTAKSVKGKYSVSLTGAPSGTKIVNTATSKVATSFATNETFKVMIPVSSAQNIKTTITVNIKATGSVDKAYEYKSTDTSVQNVYGKALYPTTTNLSAKTTLSLSTSKVSITKIDSRTKAGLAGAEFVLYDNSGKKITSWTSTTKAHIIQNLPNGTYTLKETKAPAGYKISKESTKFTITDKNRNITLNVENTIYSKVSIVKIDSKTKVALAGAEFVLYDNSGKKITSWTSTGKAHVIQNLPNGTYTLKETKAPAGYKISKESTTFTISDTNRDLTVKVENTALTKLVNIVKIDKSTGQPLAGAHLVVKNEKGDIIADFVSTEEPYVIKDLADGKYSVYEVEAPDGYKKSEATYYFTISDGNTVASVTVENEKENQPEEVVEVPNTESHDSVIPIALGSTALLSGVGFVYYNEKKKKQK